MEIEINRVRLVPNTPADIRAQIDGMKPDERAQVSPDWLARAYAATEPDPWALGFAIERPIIRETATQRKQKVCARTLAEASASTRVLAKCDFRPVGQVVDAEDGLVWRWERAY